MSLPPPLLVSEHPALDFLNSIGAPYGETIEWLVDGAALLAWMQAAGLLTAEETARAQGFAASDLDQTAAACRDLRETCRAWLTGSGDAAVLITELNRLMAAVPSVSVLAEDGEGYRLRHSLPLEDTDGLMARIASSLADLMSSGALDRTRQCSGETCTFWFRDTSRNNSRRWCSMAVCGNRAKVRAHRARDEA